MNENGHRIILRLPLSCRWQRLTQYVLFLTVAIIMLVTSGCAEINIRFGNRPDPAALETSLRIGESTSADVLRVLGKPYGRGKELLPVFGKEGFMLTAREHPRDIMAYYYEESTMEDSRRIILYVYLDNDRYDGYMWFSSLPGIVGAKVIQPATESHVSIPGTRVKQPVITPRASVKQPVSIPKASTGKALTIAVLTSAGNLIDDHHFERVMSDQQLGRYMADTVEESLQGVLPANTKYTKVADKTRTRALIYEGGSQEESKRVCAQFSADKVIAAIFSRTVFVGSAEIHLYDCAKGRKKVKLVDLDTHYGEKYYLERDFEKALSRFYKDNPELLQGAN